ncbi:MAG: hypothetical protein WED00_05015 [Aquisalimonadaceae bacterium]
MPRSLLVAGVAAQAPAVADDDPMLTRFEDIFTQPSEHAGGILPSPTWPGALVGNTAERS